MYKVKGNRLNCQNAGPFLQRGTEIQAGEDGSHSDTTIAEWMNTQPVIHELRQGSKPIGKEMVRDLLQNRTYIGQVPYAETLYNGSLGEGKRATRHRKQWFEGRHEGIVSEHLFDICQRARKKLTK